MISPETEDDVIHEYKDEIWRASLASYANKVSGGNWKPYRHSKYLAHQIQDAILQDGGRLIISQPPQTGKSTLTSLWTPIWTLDVWPETRIILCSYSGDKAEQWASNQQDIYENSELVKGSIGETARADRWTTSEGGYVVATSVGGQMTGWSGDLIIIDDPLKGWEDANSATTRKKQRRWFDSVVNTRAQEDTTILLAMTRWHEEDLAGFLVDRGWDHIRLPALAESESDPLDREVGESICPKLYSTEYYDNIKESVADVVWAGLYQQRPTVEGGNIFKRDEVTNFYNTLPEGNYRWYQSWDFSFGSMGENASFVVGLVWAVSEGEAYLVDYFRKRTDFDGMVAGIKELSQRYPQAYTKLVENKAAGPLIIQRLRKKIRGLTKVDPGSSSKTERAVAVKECFAAGDVYFPNPEYNPWVGDMIDEMLQFPGGANDDYVDALTQFLIYWTEYKLNDWW